MTTWIKNLLKWFLKFAGDFSLGIICICSMAATLVFIVPSAYLSFLSRGGTIMDASIAIPTISVCLWIYNEGWRNIRDQTKRPIGPITWLLPIVFAAAFGKAHLEGWNGAFNFGDLLPIITPFACIALLEGFALVFARWAWEWSGKVLAQWRTDRTEKRKNEHNQRLITGNEPDINPDELAFLARLEALELQLAMDGKR